MNNLFEDATNIDPEKYRVILFDLGGVLFNIDLPRAYKSFLELPRSSKASIPLMSDFFAEKIFWELETGRITENEFVKAAIEQFELQAEPNQVISAWNQVLDGVVKEGELAIEGLKRKFQLFLLSNSNRIHYRALENECKNVFSHFEHCFFSFDLGLHKPELDIYIKACENGGFKPQETLFIDDSRPNAEAAVELGFDALHWPNREKAPEFWKIIASWTE